MHARTDIEAELGPTGTSEATRCGAWQDGENETGNETGNETREAAYARALRMLAAREHSVHELRGKLLVKGHPPAAIQEALSSLQEQGLLSDRRFAEVYVRSRINRGYGPICIRRDLYQRGLNDELIDAELTCAAERWIELASSVRGKRFTDGPPADRNAWNTQARFLARRGFPADLIYRVLGQI